MWRASGPGTGMHWAKPLPQGETSQAASFAAVFRELVSPPRCQDDKRNRTSWHFKTIESQLHRFKSLSFRIGSRIRRPRRFRLECLASLPGIAFVPNEVELGQNLISSCRATASERILQNFLAAAQKSWHLVCLMFEHGEKRLQLRASIEKKENKSIIIVNIKKPSFLFAIFNFVQKRWKYLPGPDQLIIPDEAFLLPSHARQNEPSVGQGAVDFFVAMVVRQIKFRGGYTLRQAWLLHVEFEIDCFMWRNLHHQFIPRTFLFEEPGVGVTLFELDPHFALALLQSPDSENQDLELDRIDPFQQVASTWSCIEAWSKALFIWLAFAGNRPYPTSPVPFDLNVSSKPFPALMINGTPHQRSLLMRSTSCANVAQYLAFSRSFSAMESSYVGRSLSRPISSLSNRIQGLSILYIYIYTTFIYIYIQLMMTGWPDDQIAKHKDSLVWFHTFVVITYFTSNPKESKMASAFAGHASK